MSCVFCKIVKGEIPSLKVFENEHVLVFMDIAKDVDGHLLAIPKKHVKDIFDCDEQTLAHLMNAVKQVADHCVNECGYDGVNLLNANDESAGQSVPHFHVHMILRKKEDHIDAWPKFDGAECELESIHNVIKMNQ